MTTYVKIFRKNFVGGGDYFFGSVEGSVSIGDEVKAMIKRAKFKFFPDGSEKHYYATGIVTEIKGTI